MALYITEHHAFAAIPCYHLKRFHEVTREHWDRPQTLTEAWREMNAKSLAMIHIPSAGAASSVRSRVTAT